MDDLINLSNELDLVRAHLAQVSGERDEALTQLVAARARVRELEADVSRLSGMSTPEGRREVARDILDDIAPLASRLFASPGRKP